MTELATQVLATAAIKMINVCTYNIVKVIKATYHQADERYGIARGIQCSCMALMFVCWTLLKPVQY